MMTLSLAIVNGFQNEIEKKISGFGAHISISNYESKGLIEQKPFSNNRAFIAELSKIEGVKHCQMVANKGLILKTKTDNYGAIAKGIGNDFDWSFFEENLVKGKVFHPSDTGVSNEILISKAIANKLNVNVDESLFLYFMQQPPRYRKVKIIGIYHSGLGEMDERMVLIDLRHIQKINGWETGQIGAVEVIVDDPNKIHEIDERVYEKVDYDLTATSIVDSRPDIFNWLELQDVNVIVIISLLILVCGIDIISALLILILERTNMIGILKAMGSSDNSIRKIFIYNASYLIIHGLIWGNILGIGLALLQNKFKFLKLPQEAYFIDTVPIEFHLSDQLLLNLGTFICCFIMLIIPSNIVAKISPIKAIRFD